MCNLSDDDIEKTGVDRSLSKTRCEKLLGTVVLPRRRSTQRYRLRSAGPGPEAPERRL